MGSQNFGIIDCRSQFCCFDKRNIGKAAITGLEAVAFLGGITALVVGLLGHFGVIHGLSSVVSYVLIGIGGGGIGTSFIGCMILSVISSCKAKSDGSLETDREGTGFVESMFSSRKGIDSKTGFPKWLAKHSEDVPRLPIPGDGNSLTFSMLENAMGDRSTGAFGSTLCMRLEVNHENVDPSYTRTGRVDPALSSSRDPLSIYVIVWAPTADNDLWFLTSDTSEDIEHRGGSMSRGSILGDNRYCFYSNDRLNKKTTENFLSISNQDELSKKYRFDLKWLLVRLLNGQNVKVREAKGLILSFDDPAVGYWNITLA